MKLLTIALMLAVAACSVRSERTVQSPPPATTTVATPAVPAATTTVTTPAAPATSTTVYTR